LLDQAGCPALDQSWQVGDDVSYGKESRCIVEGRRGTCHHCVRKVLLPCFSIEQGGSFGPDHQHATVRGPHDGAPVDDPHFAQWKQGEAVELTEYVGRWARGDLDQQSGRQQTL